MKSDGVAPPCSANFQSLKGIKVPKDRTQKPSRVPRSGVIRPARVGQVRLGRKGFSTATTFLRIGIQNLETATGKFVAEIHHGAAQVLRADGIHQDFHAMLFGREVALAFLVEHHAVLHPGAAALLHIDTKMFAGIFGQGQQDFAFLGSARREADDRCS